MSVNETHLNAIIGCTGLYDEAFYRMGLASPTRRHKMNYFSNHGSQYAQLRPSCVLVWKVQLTYITRLRQEVKMIKSNLTNNTYLQTFTVLLEYIYRTAIGKQQFSLIAFIT